MTRCGWQVSLLLAGVALAAPAVAAAGITILPASEMPVELLRPLPGEALEAGREATIAWRPLRDLSADGIEEWEAFLSLDGGRRWPVRITPHLDIDLTSFSFVVPAVPSDDVRLMLRFGDERREVGYILPLTLRSVVLDAAADRPPPQLHAFEPGEAARPGDPGVVLWVEGGRDGRNPRLRASAWTPPARLTPASPRLADPSTAMAPDRRLLEWTATGPLLLAAARVAAGAPPTAEAPGHALSLLLLLCRQNE